ncbi:MAG: 2-dehydro-3-deoxygluconokinase [Planctomycetes bacterium ADurb.Bin412]|nr:MAG: 2-dehydro-3-deoxygluconokinase [Planctomycetes bacterium ADurb.Bin412]
MASNKKKAVFFGELMMRLATKHYERIVQAREFEVDYTGAEANVGVSLVNYGMESYVVSAVPDNAVGQACLNAMRQYGHNIDYVQKRGFRLGIYYVETGVSQRPSTFLYNRKGSAITEMRVGDYPWAEIFAGKDWFHFTGITPALADSVAEITKEACIAAKKAGVTISCDLNFRKKLWSKEKASQVMTDLMQYVDVLFTNEEEAQTLFGIHASQTDITSGKLNKDGYEDVARQLVKKFNLKYVSISLRESISASVNDWSGMIYDGKKSYFSRVYHIDHIVDRIGGGDAFSSGVIYGLLNGWSMQDTVEFAAAASCLKHTIHRDFNLVSLDEVMALVKGDASGRIQR